MAAPVVYELGHWPGLADVFPAFSDVPYPALLGGAAPGATGGRYSYLVADPFLVVRSRGRRVTLEQDGACEEVEGDPWTVLQGLVRRCSLARVPGLPPLQGGAVGYLSYDLGRHIERLPSLARDDTGLPELCMGLYDWVVAHDGDTGQAYLVSTGLPDGSPGRAEIRAREVLRRLGSSRSPDGAGIADARVGPRPSCEGPRLRSNFTRQEYMAAVRRIKEYLAAGDVYQVNLSQRFEAAFGGDPWPLYLRLRQCNPAPFAAYLGFPEATVLSASPEEFLRLEGRSVETRPIKGTRPRGRTPQEEERLTSELLSSEKERAENVMIVDLLRNDLGRVCCVGSVKVPALFSVEQHPTVWHLVSTVAGTLRYGLDAVDLLRACFPGGSVTGAPKVRAMEIIEELEPVRRGVYCGAVGYISFTGDMNTSIAIRTIVVARDRLYLQVGGGIVADSDPESEYQETLHKGEGLRRALGAAF
ncbi:MAG: aminodeoxychorismate synthase component I [Chloroflexi bacterium]|nr:aminodeoxychorismate synthase component I [Chloroflexota bacterium]